MKCEVCGHEVRVVSGREGTNHYEPDCGAEVERLRGALEAEQESSLHDVLSPCSACAELREKRTDDLANADCPEALRLQHRAYDLRENALAKS